MKIFYHNDLDGRCAAAIVRLALKQSPTADDGYDVQYIEMDYNRDVPIEDIQPDERIIIVDFSFKPEVMEKVLKITFGVVWIDHHKTIFDYKYSKELDGIRDVNFSGCELAWKYFFPDRPMPRAVELIGDRDKWAWKFGKETAEFNMGMQIRSHQPQDVVWNNLLLPFLPEYNWAEEISFTGMEHIRKDGCISLLFREQFCKDYANSSGFETMFEGHKCFALNLYHFGSETFGDRIDKYDVCLSFVFNGKNWQVSLYSKCLDVSEIAKIYGGGGHKGAAGFVCDKLPFRKINYYDKI